MDFRKILKSKVFIVCAIFALLIIISSSLTSVSMVFVTITEVLCGCLCVFGGTVLIIKAKKTSEDNIEELLPLTEKDTERVNKSKRSAKFNYIACAIIILLGGLYFFLLACK